MLLQHFGLVLQHFGLVDLVDRHAVRPLQAVGPRVQTGGQDDHLPDPGLDRVGEVLVEEVRAHGLVVDADAMRAATVLVAVEPGQLRIGEPGPCRTGRRDQYAGELVADQRVAPGGLRSPRRGDAQRGGSDQFGDGPAVAGRSQGGR